MPVAPPTANRAAREQLKIRPLRADSARERPPFPPYIWLQPLEAEDTLMFGGTTWLLPGTPLRSWPKDDCWRDLLRAADEDDANEEEEDDDEDDEDDDFDDDEEFDDDDFDDEDDDFDDDEEFDDLDDDDFDDLDDDLDDEDDEDEEEDEDLDGEGAP